MWRDKQNMFSEKQTLINAVTASSILSTNVIDLGDPKKGEGEPIEVLAQMTTSLASAGAATYQFVLKTSAAENMGTPTTLFDSGALALATLVAGYQLAIRVLPNDALQYLQWTYIQAGAVSTAGAFESGLIRNIPTNK